MSDIGLCIIKMIEIDGTEGGGQMLRTALALSTITGKAFKAVNIRKSRPKPGLKNQHLACIEALEKLSFADVRGAQPGADSIIFHPGKIQLGTYSINIGTAGSITLLLQSVLLPCCLAKGKTRLKIKGGTDTKWSMPIDYLFNVVLPHFSMAEIKIKDIRRGFYPKGGGYVDLIIKPNETTPEPINLVEKPSIDKVKGISAASSDLRSAEVAERQAKAAKKKLRSLDIPIKIAVEYKETASPGTVITLWAGSMGSDALGEPRKRAEAVGAEAAAELLLLLCSDAVVDNHLADNLIPLMAMFGGKIKVHEITNHIRTNIAVCEKFNIKRKYYL